ncbi:MAG TPA: aminoacyl-tRNA hydrolase [Phycisphaerae bacterium]|nr:aminoacyl-tRNA hydrolase [Phycisphaerae bacterium]
MKLIVGLGNPGTKYEFTRHNIGFRVVDELARRHAISMNAEKFHGWFGTGAISSEKVVLLKPTTFMNRSGSSVLSAGRFYRLEFSDLLVVADDVALDTGRLRLRAKGSSGGHNGLGDIITRIGSDQFCRLRFGVGQPLGSQVDYVLGRFHEDEEVVIGPAIKKAADACEHWLVNGPLATMNEYNG